MFGNIQIAQTTANTIDTKSGSLTLSSASGGMNINVNELDVNANMDVSGNVDLNSSSLSKITTMSIAKVQSTTNSTSKTTGALKVFGGVGINNDLHVGGDITAFASSDINLKENINVIPNALDKINAISGNTFTWKDSDKGEDTGVIAQEIEALGLPGVTTVRDDGTKAVRYEKLVPVLIQAIKELSAKVDALS